MPFRGSAGTGSVLLAMLLLGGGGLLSCSRGSSAIDENATEGPPTAGTHGGASLDPAPEPGPPAEAPERLVPETFELGEVWMGQRLEHELPVGNSTNGPLWIDHIRLGCQCLGGDLVQGDRRVSIRSIKDDPFRLAPGSTATMELWYEVPPPSVETEDDIHQRVRFSIRDDDGPRSVQLLLTGHARTPITVEPRALRTDGVRAGTRAASSVRLVPNTPLRIAGFECTARDKVQVRLIEVDEGEQRVELDVLPTAPTGLIVGTVLFHIEDSVFDEFQIPIFVTVIP